MVTTQPKPPVSPLPTGVGFAMCQATGIYFLHHLLAAREAIHSHYQSPLWVWFVVPLPFLFNLLYWAPRATLTRAHFVLSTLLSYLVVAFSLSILPYGSGDYPISTEIASNMRHALFSAFGLAIFCLNGILLLLGFLVRRFLPLKTA
jgi:hypothetical protein